MKRFLTGLVLGILIGTVLTCAYAYVARVLLVDGSQIAIGTATNPLVINAE